MDRCFCSTQIWIDASLSGSVKLLVCNHHLGPGSPLRFYISTSSLTNSQLTFGNIYQQCRLYMRQPQQEIGQVCKIFTQLSVRRILSLEHSQLYQSGHYGEGLATDLQTYQLSCLSPELHLYNQTSAWFWLVARWVWTPKSLSNCPKPLLWSNSL